MGYLVFRFCLFCFCLFRLTRREGVLEQIYYLMGAGLVFVKLEGVGEGFLFLLFLLFLFFADMRGGKKVVCDFLQVCSLKPLQFLGTEGRLKEVRKERVEKEG